MTNEDAGGQPAQETPVTLRTFSTGLADEVAKPTWLDRLNKATREAPMQSLIIAFLIGVMLARR